MPTAEDLRLRARGIPDRATAERDLRRIVAAHRGHLGDADASLGVSIGLLSRVRAGLTVFGPKLIEAMYGPRGNQIAPEWRCVQLPDEPRHTRGTADDRKIARELSGEAGMARELAKLRAAVQAETDSRFERDCARVRAGAQLIARPVFAAAERDYSLTG